MIVKLAVNDLLRRGFNSLGDIWSDEPFFCIHLRCGKFNSRQGVHHLNGHALTAYGEIFMRTLCLRAPISPSGHGDIAK